MAWIRLSIFLMFYTESVMMSEFVVRIGDQGAVLADERRQRAHDLLGIDIGHAG